jgi:hypothetical protein
MSGCRSVCQNSGYFNNSLLCVPAALREDLVCEIRRFAPEAWVVAAPVLDAHAQMI